MHIHTYIIFLTRKYKKQNIQLTFVSIQYLHYYDIFLQLLSNSMEIHTFDASIAYTIFIIKWIK